MKILLLATLFTGAWLFPANSNGASVIVNGQTAGPTPFIANVQLTANPPASVKSINFKITPKAGSVTRPVNVTNSIDYLRSRGYFNSQTGAILLPVFGLYANYTNTVTLAYTFTDNSVQTATVMISTPAFSTSCGYNTPTAVQARTGSTALSYDYMILKNMCGSNSPTIIDTDGQVRWVGTAGVTNFASVLFQNSIYIANAAVIYRIEFDGTSTQLRNYSSDGVVDFHHNIDFGKRGILLGVDTAAQTEAVTWEVDGLGNILKTWNMADIITAAMTAGGDNASLFVKSSPNDWFHNNANTYKRSDDSLLVSSRENFVIALDYQTSAIKWILGDPNKQWHQFPSLVAYALTAGTNTLYPIGEHAISITQDDNLLLFDNGKSSLNHTPAGLDRFYSAPRKFQINTQSKVATELWNYQANQSFYSPFCASVYEDSPLNYLVDYAFLGNSAAMYTEVLGLDSVGNKIFHYHYPALGCDISWNAFPIHFEQMSFTALVPPAAVSRKTHGAAGSFDVALPLAGNAGVECRSGGTNGDYQIVATFAAPVTITSASVTPGSGGSASISGSPVISGNSVTVNLTNVSNAQTIMLNLLGVNDGSHTENVSVPMGVLIGDTTGDRLTNSSDIAQVKSQSGQPVGVSNFRQDAAANGSINSSDVALVKSKSGTGITMTNNGVSREAGARVIRE